MAVFIRKIEGVNKVGSFLRSLPDRINGGVGVNGPAAAYSLVWEFGSARISKPGPKTIWGVNPRGERVVLTLTAPNGYIWIHREEYLAALKEELAGVNLASADGWKTGFKDVVNRASARSAVLIQDSAPFDIGQLREGIEPMEAE